MAARGIFAVAGIALVHARSRSNNETCLWGHKVSTVVQGVTALLEQVQHLLGFLACKPGMSAQDFVQQLLFPPLWRLCWPWCGRTGKGGWWQMIGVARHGSLLLSRVTMPAIVSDGTAGVAGSFGRKSRAPRRAPGGSHGLQGCPQRG